MDFYERGRSAAQRGDFGKAIRLLTDAGRDGRALLLLGQMASSGRGQPVDKGRAVEYYEQAADLGNSEAAYNLAAIYAAGGGVEADHKTAFYWYRRSAELGNVDALRMIGVMYAYGQGVEVDLVAAEKALDKAAARGQRDAPRDLGRLFIRVGSPVAAARWYLEAARRGDRDVVDEILRLAPSLKALADEGDTSARTYLGVIFMQYVDAPAETIALLRKSADEGDPIAQRSLGFLYHQGELIEADPARALKLFRSAAEGGDGIAAYNLGLRYLKGEGVERDSAAAIHWLRIAANSGVVEAYPHLGNELAAVDEDAEALSWYLRGAEVGQAGCMYAAGCWYRDGIGTPVDLVESLRWFIAMLRVGNGNGIHEAQSFIRELSDEQIRLAARRAGSVSDGEVFIQQRQEN
ncbi:tetratricopeptide repeat protein [Micromonospora sp. NPDC047738]|uniref:tetratricopeptide repeat protein n=1 Tax=unclassified Micromonospora TaxID=2617518 RepID=UPI0033D066A5